MKYNVAVIGPARRQGETTLSIIISIFLQKILKSRVCLTSTGNENITFKEFLGLDLKKNDYTRSISQLVRLLSAGTVSDKDIEDYMCSIANCVDLLRTSEDGMSSEQSGKLLLECMGYLNYPFVVTDINTELSDDVTQSILKKSDLVIMVISQGIDVINKMKCWQEHALFPEEHKVVYIVNQYDPTVCALREVSKQLGVKHVRVAKLNYNSWIKKSSNQGKLDEIVPCILNKDSRVVDLLVDISEIMYMISNQLGIAIKWPSEIG